MAALLPLSVVWYRRGSGLARKPTAELGRLVGASDLIHPVPRARTLTRRGPTCLVGAHSTPRSGKPQTRLVPTDHEGSTVTAVKFDPPPRATAAAAPTGDVR